LDLPAKKYPDHVGFNRPVSWYKTSRDNDSQFSVYKTYYISDYDCPEVTTNPNDSLWFDLSAKTITSLLLKDDMATRGYTFVPKGSHP
jgi:hypothetical protein